VRYIGVVVVNRPQRGVLLAETRRIYRIRNTTACVVVPDSTKFCFVRTALFLAVSSQSWLQTQRNKMGAKFLIRVQFGSQEQFVCLIRRGDIASTVTFQFWKEFRLLSHLDHMQLRLFLDSGEELYSGDRLYPLRHHVFVLKVVSKTAPSYFEQWKVDRSNVYWNIFGQHVVLNTRERSVKKVQIEAKKFV
jgi:hypothetical protein